MSTGIPVTATPPFREIVVFFPNENDELPLTLAQSLVEALGVGRADYGVDALTGSVEVRLWYDPAILMAARDWLAARQIVFDVNLL